MQRQYITCLLPCYDARAAATTYLGTRLHYYKFLVILLAEQLSFFWDPIWVGEVRKRTSCVAGAGRNPSFRKIFSEK